MLVNINKQQLMKEKYQTNEGTFRLSAKFLNS